MSAIVGKVEMDVEGSLPPSEMGGMVETTVAGVWMPLMRRIPISACVVVMGPLEGILLMMDDKDVGPLPTTPP